MQESLNPDQYPKTLAATTIKKRLLNKTGLGEHSTADNRDNSADARRG
jgi:hypothetical protein